MIQNNITKFIAMLVTGGALLAACKKDGDPLGDKISKIKQSWKITAISTPKAGQPNVDSSLLKACTTDDIIQFTNTGFDFKDGATVCDSTVFGYAKGVWAYKLTGDSIQLQTTAPTPAKYIAWKVVTLNDSVMQVRYTDSTNPAKKILKTVSFKH
ncbi:MAG: hypothetical protein EOP47_16335 [Sphingobacteriaceae bacterium]|nr:MAG: hypothetical protein EOP47_16335 [Sphingobacteriaceae bacterium]